MASFNPGRNVGRVSIRVVPDTKRFRMDLAKSLRRIERSTHFTVNVDKADVNRTKLREDIRRQMAGLTGAKAKVTPTMDRLTIERLRGELIRRMKDIEITLDGSFESHGIRRQLDAMAAQFDRLSGRLANDVMSPADAERLRHRLNTIKNHIDQVARNREARIDANPFTAWASARLAWLTRARVVDIFVRVSKASVAKALVTLAALSGARLTWKWIDDLIEKARNLDKNLPAILNWTSGITALVAALAASTSGLVGIGQGLFQILPAFLVLPGLLLNAVGSVTALIVALRNSSKELSVLKDDMHELGDLINEAFWDRARKPIIDLVQGLMPQLRNAFRDLSSGVGDFTAAMAKAFGEELANGRLESIFNGIAEGWRVLGSGASGFAGALVNLSQIAAKYTPRLAHWFVRQAATFDDWLTAISTDGRLDAWMEDAVDSMYDVWDATKGIAGVFAGLWKAAEAAGSGGLRGFAQMMLDWSETVNSAKFQQGMTAIFRGSGVAMRAFGDAVASFGDLVASMPDQFERFVGSAGGFIGRVLDESFKALDNANVQIGMDRFSGGLERAIDKITPSLAPIAATFGNFIGTLGTMAETILPTAVGAISDLMPVVDSLLGAVDRVLPGLTGAVGRVVDTLAPAVKSFVDAVTPALEDAFTALGDALEIVAPGIADLAVALGPSFASVIGSLTEVLRPLATILGPIASALGWLSNFNFNVFDPASWDISARWEQAAKAFPDLIPGNNDAQMLMESYRLLGQKTGDAFGAAFNQNRGRTMVSPFNAPGQNWLEDALGKGTQSGEKFTSGVLKGVEAQRPFWQAQFLAVGNDGMTKIGEGANSRKESAIAPFGRVPGEARSRVRANGGGFWGIGKSMMDGLAAGINAGRSAVIGAAVGAAVGAKVAAMAKLGIQSPSKVMRKEVGLMIGRGLALGIDDSRREVERAGANLFDPDMVTRVRGTAPETPAHDSGSGVSLHIHNPVTRDLQREAWEAAQTVGALI